MTTTFPRFLPAILVVMLCNLAAEAGTAESELARRLAAASKYKRYDRVSRSELRTAEQLFVATMSGSQSLDALADRWSKLGWKLETLSQNEESFTLSEMPANIRGRGFFAFRRSDAIPVAIQAPHSFYDKHTGQIAQHIFQNQPVAAAAWNTVRRSVMDAAHYRDSYLNAFTQAFLQTHSRHAVLQLHGFAQGKRTTTAGRTSDVIVSNGTRFPGRMTRNIAEALRKAPPIKAALYPTQVKELGGTKNVQAALVHQHGYDSFVHIELSQVIRKKLINDPILRSHFCGYLFSSLPSLLSDPK